MRIECIYENTNTRRHTNNYAVFGGAGLGSHQYGTRYGF